MIAAENGNTRELSLRAFLEIRARAASEGRLAVDIGVGVSAVIVSAGLRPEWWKLLLCAGLCLASFGIWEMTRRAASSVGNRSVGYVVRGVHLIAAATGVGAALATGFFLWMIVMGTWIS